MRVLVVGGGVVGLCASYFLRRAGFDVVVVDRGRCGEGASLGNAGWITRFHGPLPAPGVVVQAIRWTLRGQGPLRIHVRPDRALAEWLWRFLRVARNGSYSARLQALVALNGSTFDLYDRLRADNVGFPQPTQGTLLVCLTRREFAHQLEELAHLREAGYEDPVEILEGDEVRDLEPSLSPRVKAGLFVSNDRCIRPELVTAALAARLRSELRQSVPAESSFQRISADCRYLAASAEKRSVMRVLA